MPRVHHPLGHPHRHRQRGLAAPRCDTTATFDILDTGEGLVLALDDVHLV
jgi:hypothetical protein